MGRWERSYRIYLFSKHEPYQIRFSEDVRSYRFRENWIRSYRYSQTCTIAVFCCFGFVAEHFAFFGFYRGSSNLFYNTILYVLTSTLPNVFFSLRIHSLHIIHIRVRGIPIGFVYFFFKLWSLPPTVKASLTVRGLKHFSSYLPRVSRELHLSRAHLSQGFILLSIAVL